MPDEETKDEKINSDTPLYGSQEYWNNRYKSKEEQHHQWYFTYSDLRPLILPLILGSQVDIGVYDSKVDQAASDDDEESVRKRQKRDHETVENSPVVDDSASEDGPQEDEVDGEWETDAEEENDSESESSPERPGFGNKAISIMEIGCGDMPLGVDLDADLSANGNHTKHSVLCTDYSEACINELKLKYESVKFQQVDSRRPSFEDKSFNLILEKGTLDAMLSDPEKGKANCVEIVSECARLLDMGGYVLIVSHMNANTVEGLEWLENIVFSGLKRGDPKASFGIEVHGNSGEDPGPAVYIIEKKEQNTKLETIPVQFCTY